jgi:predicted phosphodiesterase
MKIIKTISVGDIHGRDCWKQIDPSKYDRIIFVGDYVDSHSHPDAKILSNFKAIIGFKKKHMSKVILLLGNHDIQYLYYPQFPCSGFRPEMRPKLTALFNKNKSFFQVAYQLKNVLWTHAGVSKGWYQGISKTIADYKKERPNCNLADILNLISESKHYKILHTVGSNRGGYAGAYGGITWADNSETHEDCLDGYHQIVGHSVIRTITTIPHRKSSITYIDCLETEVKFLELTIKLTETQYLLI